MSVGAMSLGAQWMALWRLSPTGLARGSATLEMLAVQPPQVVLRST